jgi:hypothetical protein
VRESIWEVAKTPSEAVIRGVGDVLFLQNLRATLIPTIAGWWCCPAPSALAVFGYSINMLTMFAVVLAIGLLRTTPSVDNASGRGRAGPLARRGDALVHGSDHWCLIGIATWCWLRVFCPWPP